MLMSPLRTFSQGNDGTTAPPPLAKSPFTPAAARKYQEAWAKHLGLPVEQTNSMGMKLVLIPPGEFMMGSPTSEKGHNRGEGAQRLVRITKPFYLAVYLVTQREYTLVMGTNPSFFSATGEGKN